LIGCSASDIFALFTASQNGFPFFAVANEQIFVLNEAEVSPNTKESHKVLFLT
jgi:hypothetical protein